MWHRGKSLEVDMAQSASADKIMSVYLEMLLVKPNATYIDLALIWANPFHMGSGQMNTASMIPQGAESRQPTAALRSLPPEDFPSDFLIEEEDFCSRQRRRLFLLAYVHSSILATRKRSHTRATWAGGKGYGVGLGVVFMVGRARTPEEQRIVQEESRLHHDIVQGNYTDTYELLSLKALASLAWVSRHCSPVPWTLHADDDVLVDPFLLTSLLRRRLSREKNKFLCYPWKGSKVQRQGRWAVQYEDYPNATYPEYCMGAAWVVQTHVIPSLLSAAARVPFLWVDDVYVTGILAQGAAVKHSPWMRKFISRENISEEDIGKKVIWYHLGEDRSAWWKLILGYHGYH
ncbi:beta-1,3-galactosyltransferase 1-like [Penaeus chinensis]|uniref:beta-1,3-galactosyltransferase 1-like n=1 Tax=Penaeus chinensis TaxID=139456 RepID=UPI001FB6A258|nr:beta-1,3-galactosyltransferase 1-like [Penaeus chinensis]